MVVFTNGLQWVKTPVSCNRVRRAICPEPSGYEWYMDWRGLGAYLQHSKADPFQPLNYPRMEKEQIPRATKNWFTGSLLNRADMSQLANLDDKVQLNVFSC